MVSGCDSVASLWPAKQGGSVSEAVNRTAQCYRGGYIFNVLYQIDVFWGRDDGITTEAAHNAIKCIAAFRRATIH
ncbi:hypothetical protein EHR23_24350 [Escherichia coli]|nr:hypothetical protein [Escherichia coli]